MRLDTESSQRSHSPSKPLSNGSTTLSPGSRAGIASKVTNGKTHSKSDSNGSLGSLVNGNASNASAANGRPFPDTFFGHDREEVTRILIQSLTDLGYAGAAAVLSQESGFELEGPTVAAFRNSVLEGAWIEAEALLFGSSTSDEGGGVGLNNNDNKMGYAGRADGKSTRNSWAQPVKRGGLKLAEGASKSEMKFWLRQQKYLELLEKRDIGAALQVLRSELQPLRHDTGRLHALSTLIMCQSADDLKAQAHWDGAAGESRRLLLSDLSRCISPSIMIPESRLAVLLDQVKKTWVSGCLYHNTAASPSLYVDHICDQEDFPRTALLELSHHSDEVWFLRFSHDGTKLATASKDSQINIYDTTTYKVLHTLTKHDSGVCYLAWSPDDTKLISCCQAQENAARVWDTSTGICTANLSSFTYPVTSAVWAPNGETFIVGTQDTNAALGIYNLRGDIIHLWKEEGLRVHDVAISPNGRRLVALLEQRLVVYDLPSREKIREYTVEDVKLTSVNISRDSKRMLVSINPNSIRLMDIESGELLQSYEGLTQSNYVIRSAFGGADENFVISGSEDSRVCIWRMNGTLIESLDAHRGGCVNAVVWHPTDPRVFASAGDDGKVRIWTTQHNPNPLGSSRYRSTTTNGFSR